MHLDTQIPIPTHKRFYRTTEKYKAQHTRNKYTNMTNTIHRNTFTHNTRAYPHNIHILEYMLTGKYNIWSYSKQRSRNVGKVIFVNRSYQLFLGCNETVRNFHRWYLFSQSLYPNFISCTYVVFEQMIFMFYSFLHFWTEFYN